MMKEAANRLGVKSLIRCADTSFMIAGARSGDVLDENIPSVTDIGLITHANRCSTISRSDRQIYPVLSAARRRLPAVSRFTEC